MNVTQQIAQHLRGVYFGGNWTDVCLKDKLDGMTWQQATAQVESFHSVATLLYHINYFVIATLGVLRGGPLDAKDKYSFDCPPIDSDDAWRQMLQRAWQDAEDLAAEIERLPEGRLEEPFVKEQYGNYYRCLQGLIEHCHYHLGQIALVKMLVAKEG